MGPGHLAIGLAAKSAAPRVPLWVLLLATETLDLLGFAFRALGIETFGITQTTLTQGVQVIVPGLDPWSHGLFMSVVWSALAAAIAFLIYRERRTAGIIGLVVFSHWVLDFIVHPPDLLLFFNGSPSVGLGLWTSGPGFIISIILEIGLLAEGIAIYLAARKREDVPEHK